MKPLTEYMYDVTTTSDGQGKIDNASKISYTILYHLNLNESIEVSVEIKRN